MEELQYREKIANIDKQLAEHDKLRQDYRLDLIRLFIYGLVIGAGIVLLTLKVANAI